MVSYEELYSLNIKGGKPWFIHGCAYLPHIDDKPVLLDIEDNPREDGEVYRLGIYKDPDAETLETWILTDNIETLQQIINSLY